jgi:hypothetical protein
VGATVSGELTSAMVICSVRCPVFNNTPPRAKLEPKYMSQVRENEESIGQQLQGK